MAILPFPVRAGSIMTKRVPIEANESPTFILVFILSPQIIKILYGNQYLPAVPALQILIWNVVLIYIGFIYSVALKAANKQRVVMYAVAGGGLFSIILNFILIPKFGLDGAAIATVISQLILVICLAGYFKKFKKIVQYS